MALGFLWGEAAKATNSTLRDWQQMFDARKAQEGQEKAQSQALELQRRQLDWAKESQEIAQKFQLGTITRNEVFQVGKSMYDDMGDKTPAQQLSMLNAAKVLGSPTWLAAIEGRVSETYQRAPSEAWDFLHKIDSAAPGTAFNIQEVRVVAKGAAQGIGLTGKEADAYVDTYVNAAQNSIDNKEIVDREGMDAAIKQNAVLEQQANNLEANTGKTKQEITMLEQQFGFNSEEHPLAVEQMQKNNTLMDQAIEKGGLELEALPAQIALGLAQARADVQGSENQNKQFDALFDYSVRQYAAKTHMDEADARVSISTELTRINMAQGQYDQVEATVRYLEEQTLSEAKSRDLTDAQIGSLNVGVLSSKVGMIQEIVAAGNGELLDKLAPDLFRGIVEGPELDALLVDLKETADSTKSNAQKQADANTRIAMSNARWAEDTELSRVQQEGARTKTAFAEADLSTYKALTFYEDIEFDQQYKLRQAAQTDRSLDQVDTGFDIDRDRLNTQTAQTDRSLDQVDTGFDIDRDRLNAQVAQTNRSQDQVDIGFGIDRDKLNAQVAQWDVQNKQTDAALRARIASDAAGKSPAAPPTILEFLKGVKDATGLTTTDIGDRKVKLEEMEADIYKLKNLSPADITTIPDMANKYGISAESVGVMLDTLQGQTDTYRDVTESSIWQVISFGQRNHLAITEADLGLSTNDPLYIGAWTSSGLAVDASTTATGEPAPEGTLTQDDADNKAGILGRVMDYAKRPDADSVYGAIPAYQELLKEYTPEELEAQGITGPSDLAPMIQKQSGAYRTNYNRAEDYMKDFNLDAENPADREKAIYDINAQQTTINQALEMYRLVSGNSRSTREDWDRVGKDMGSALSSLGLPSTESGIFGASKTPLSPSAAAVRLNAQSVGLNRSLEAIQFLEGN